MVCGVSAALKGKYKIRDARNEVNLRRARNRTDKKKRHEEVV